MKKFNKQIEISIEVDSIATKLLESFAADFKHREMVTEAIIGNCVHAGGLAYIYNSLNGYDNDINFKVGDVLFTTSRTYGYLKSDRENPPALGNEREYQNIGVCLVIDVDVYRNDKLKVKFVTVSKEKSGLKIEMKEDWISHTNSDIIAGNYAAEFDDYLKTISEMVDDNNNPIVAENS